MKVSYCSKTDLGLKHPINSDALGDKKTKNGHVFVVADGSPVDANGSFASRLAVQSILDFFEKEVFDNIFIGINHAFQFANEQVYRASILEEGLKGIFASVAVVLVREEGVYYAHIGNARVYLKSEGVLKRLTTDHGYLDVQLYPSNDVDYSKPVVKLPKALGNTPSISPSVCLSKLDVAAGDVLIVCTHGITKVLDDQAINQKVEYANINSNILELVDAAKGKSAPENVTLQLIAVTEGNIQKRMVAASNLQTSAVKERVTSTVNDTTSTQEQINLFNKISLDRKKTIKIGAAIIAVFLLIWFVFRQPHDDTDKVLDDAGEVIAKDTTNQHQDLEELMEYEKPKKAEKEEAEEEETEEDVVEEETSEEEPADVTTVDETSTTKEEVSTTPKKEEKKKEEKKSEKDSKKEDKKEKSGKSKSHTVKSGDTINALAIKYGVKAEAIRKANNISDDKIEIGQELKIPQ